MDLPEPKAERSAHTHVDPEATRPRDRRRAAADDAPRPPSCGRRDAHVPLPHPAQSAVARPRSQEGATIVEDDFFRQLAGGALADDRPAPAGASPQRPADAQPLSTPPRRPPVGPREPPTPGPPPPGGSPPRPTATGGGARVAALAALAVAGAALAALITGSTGGERSGERLPDRDVPPNRPNGRPATGAARLSAWWPASRGRQRPKLAVRWHTRGRAVIHGRLTSAAGQPIVGARLSVLAADRSKPGQGSSTAGEVRTDDRGRFGAAIALDRGAPRKLLTFVYLAHSRDKVPAAITHAELAVMGTVTVRTPIRRTRRGRSVPVAGRSPPAATVQVLLRQPFRRRWRIQRSVKASGKGRWEAAVRIPSNVPRGIYRMRARVVGSERRGFVGAESKEVRLRVR